MYSIFAYEVLKTVYIETIIIQEMNKKQQTSNPKYLGQATYNSEAIIHKSYFIVGCLKSGYLLNSKVLNSNSVKKRVIKI